MKITKTPTALCVCALAAMLIGCGERPGDDPRQTLDTFLSAAKSGDVKTAYACLSKALQEEVSFNSFAYPYEHDQITVMKYAVTGLREPTKWESAEHTIAKVSKRAEQVLIAEGDIEYRSYSLLLVKKTAFPEKEMQIHHAPLHYLLLVKEDGRWGLYPRRTIPFRTTAFFGVPSLAKFRGPDKGGPVTTTPVNKWTKITAEDSKRRYTVAIPETWKDGMDQMFPEAKRRTRVLAFLQRVGPNPSNITIHTINVSRNVLSAMDYVKKLQATGKTEAIEAPLEISRNGCQGVRYVFNTLNFVKTRSMTEYFLDDGAIIFVSSVSALDRFEKEKTEIEQILETFYFRRKE